MLKIIRYKTLKKLMEEKRKIESALRYYNDCCLSNTEREQSLYREHSQTLKELDALKERYTSLMDKHIKLIEYVRVKLDSEQAGSDDASTSL